MFLVITALKLIVALSILNVWLRNSKNASAWRGGKAQNLKEEFEVYGLPKWSLNVIGFFKVSSSISLLLSIAYPVLESPAALILAFFLSGSVFMHLKVSDPLKKSIPALSFLIMCLLIVML